MKMLAFLLGLSLMFFLMGQARATYTQNLYYGDNSTASTFDVRGLASLNALNGTCNTTLSIFADISSTPSIFYSYQFKIIENGTTLFTTTFSSTQPKTCQSLGSINVGKGVVNVTARATALAGSQNITLYLEIATTCEGNNGNLFINQTSPPNNVRYNEYQFIPTNISLGVNGTWETYKPAHCYLNGMFSPKAYISPNNKEYYYTPFNSKLGSVQISWGGFLGFADQGLEFGIIDDTTDEKTIYGGCGYGCSNTSFSINLSLEQIRNYVAYAERTATFGTNYQPFMNITIIDYTPNWVCGAWSNCVAGQQQRLCNDTGGMLSPDYQFRNCLTVNQTAILGFENYYIPADRQVCVPGYLCLGKTLLNISPTWFPDNPRWAIVPNNILYYTTVVTPEEYTEGSRSLKMWYIPPSHLGDQAQQVVIGNITTVICNDSLEGFFPETFIVLNTTFAASLDFTFPAGTTVLKFDVKRCGENAVQYSNICGKRCYSQNCSVPPSGWFIAQLYDQVEAKSVFELTKEASTNWTTYSAGLGNAVEDRNYTLVFSVLPLPWSSVFGYGNCVYFDNVRLINTQVSQIEIWCDEVYGQPCNELTDEEIQTVLIEKCVTECIGNDYYIRTVQGLTCLEEVSLNYSTCVAQYQQQQTGNQSIFIPISSISGAVINQTTGETLAQSWQASGFGFALVFLTPIFWIMLIIAITMVVASYVTKHMEIGMGAGLVILIAFTFALPELIIITIMLIVITAYIVGRAVVKAASGGE